MNNDLARFSEKRLLNLSSEENNHSPTWDERKALARIALAAKQAKPTFDEWLSSRTDTIEVDCGCVTTEAFYHWLKVAYESTPQPAHTEHDGWIKCSDKLPTDDDFVLIWPIPDFGVDLRVGQYIKFHKKGAGWFAQVNEQNYGVEWYSINVTHWMPLPAAPKPESE